MDNYCLVNTSVANLYKNPSFTSDLVTQALIWENLVICDKKANWLQVKQRDGYIAWVHSFYIIDSSIYEKHKSLHDKENWYFVKDRILEIKIKNKEKYLLPFGALIPCINYDDDSEVILPNGKKTVIEIKSLLKYYNPITLNKILELSKPLLGVPYLWGGKSSFGFDCSGFVQIIFRVLGINLPRDTSQQIKSNKLTMIWSF